MILTESDKQFAKDHNLSDKEMLDYKKDMAELERINYFK